MATIAFAGLGNMGRGMAYRLLDTGHRVHVYNRTASRAEALVERGARVFATPGKACQGADAVISMVADDVASQAVWLEPDGILTAGLADHAFAIECSTLSHAWVMDLSARCRAHGLRYIDAPVTGLPDVAAAGALTLLVGANADDLKSVRGILDALSERIIHFGPIGAGTAYKLIVNLMGAVQIASAAKGLAIAERAGLDIAAVADAIGTSQAASPQVIRNTAVWRLRIMITMSYSPARCVSRTWTMRSALPARLASAVHWAQSRKSCTVSSATWGMPRPTKARSWMPAAHRQSDRSPAMPPHPRSGKTTRRLQPAQSSITS